MGPNLLVPPKPPPEPLTRQSRCGARGELGPWEGRAKAWPEEGDSHRHPSCSPCMDLPQPTEEAQGNTGLGGLVYYSLWSIQKQLTEIIKSSLSEPHSGNVHPFVVEALNHHLEPL